MSKREKNRGGSGSSKDDAEAKAVARMLRVSPQKLNLVAQMIRDRTPRATQGKAKSLPYKGADKRDAQVFLKATTSKTGSKKLEDQVGRSVKVLRGYREAGYKVRGSTSDGIVIVEPPSKPDSFNRAELDKALSAVRHSVK